MAKINHGARFQEDIQNSANKQDVWFMRIKDVHIPFKLRGQIKVSRNEYDNLMFYDGVLFPMELKSTQSKSVSFDEAIIKQHQIENLQKAHTYKGVIAGFLMNFRTYDNATFFIPVDRFVEYMLVAQNGLEHNYTAKVNKSSIPLDICKEIGYELFGIKKRTRYQYYIKDLLSTLSSTYNINKTPL